LPSAPVATVQLPLPSLAVQVIVWPWAITKVEARHKSAKAPPTVFPTVRNICFSLFAVGCTCAARDSSITKKNRIPSFPQGPSERNNHTYEKFNYQYPEWHSTVMNLESFTSNLLLSYNQEIPTVEDKVQK
jgi:hypothetical protein